MRRLPIALALTALLVALVPGAATAKLPSPASKLIVPGTSIGGVALNMTTAKAKRIWGPGAKCQKLPASLGSTSSELCDWRDKGNASYAANAHITFAGGKVYLISITTARTTDPRTSKPTGRQFSAWKTAKGIAIGSKSSAVGKAYPAAKHNDSEGGIGWDLIGPKGITSFGGRVTVEGVSMRLPSV